jgi:hypothetical protein
MPAEIVAPRVPPFIINVDNAGRITVEPHGGHGRFRQTTVLQWSGNGQFTLRFFTFDSGKMTPAWPFVGDPQIGLNGARTPFERALAPVAAGQVAPAYTYSISGDGYITLDPIIVVDN